MSLGNAVAREAARQFAILLGIVLVAGILLGQVAQWLFRHVSLRWLP